MLDFHWRMMKIKGLYQGAKILGLVRKLLQWNIWHTKVFEKHEELNKRTFFYSIHTFLVKCYIFVMLKITIKSEVYMNHNLYVREWLSVGTPNNELVIGEPPSKVTLTASITTAKTTLGQSATITARESAYQVQCRTQLVPIHFYLMVPFLSWTLLNNYGYMQLISIVILVI